MILMQVRKPLEDLSTSTNGTTSNTKASSPVKAATKKEPEKDEEARLSREEEKQRLIGKYYFVNRNFVFSSCH